jgi:hypothetical protein
VKEGGGRLVSSRGRASVRQLTLPLGHAAHGDETAAGTRGADAPVEGCPSTSSAEPPCTRPVRTVAGQGKRATAYVCRLSGRGPQVGRGLKPPIAGGNGGGETARSGAPAQRIGGLSAAVGRRVPRRPTAAAAGTPALRSGASPRRTRRGAAEPPLRWLKRTKN